MSASIQSGDFSAFCDFVVHLRNEGAQHLTPEESVAKFREEQEKLRRWHERNALSEEQAKRGEYGPLDLDDIMRRVRKRYAESQNEAR